MFLERVEDSRTTRLDQAQQALVSIMEHVTWSMLHKWNTRRAH